MPDAGSGSERSILLYAAGGPVGCAALCRVEAPGPKDARVALSQAGALFRIVAGRFTS